ncbi:mevalonate kinase [Bifidobacterium aemilianum]|uniref:Mevalonate kinase n=2 Tax=Bifidobacterium aemilianum TaxID=2493120 RepID=A0A366K9H4_9BIFI|nr:mevalonate kinase [Bifidobacterium aemilianum]
MHEAGPAGELRHEGDLPHSGYGQTWAKTILMGEHSVVYGHPALALPLRDLKMQAWVTPVSQGSEPMLKALDYEGPLEASGDRFAGLRRALEVTLDFVEQKGYGPRAEHGFSIRTVSDFPAGRGLGSSAAAAGAVIHAILDAYDAMVRVSREQLLSLTNQAEIVTHGHPSGLDAATTSGQDPVLFDHGNMEEISLHGSGYLVIADTGVAGSTKEAVEGVRSSYEKDPARIGGILSSLGDQASAAIKDLESGAMSRLGGRMDQAQILLDSLNVGHPTLDRLVGVARSCGALGAKLTGGGLGGCMLALAPDAACADRIRAGLTDQGATEVWIHQMAA